MQGKLLVKIGNKETGLNNPAQFVGYNKKGAEVSSVLLKNNGMHMDILIDKEHPVGQTHKAGVKDVIGESALS